MKINNLIPVECPNESSFFRAWMEFMTPFHKLTSREKDVAARIIMQYFKFRETVSDPEVLKELLWSRSSRKDIMDSLKMSQAHFQMVLAKLRTAGVIQNGTLYNKYIPDMIPGDSRFMLGIYFNWSSPKHPAKGGPEQDGKE